MIIKYLYVNSPSAVKVDMKENISPVLVTLKNVKLINAYLLLKNLSLHWAVKNSTISNVACYLPEFLSSIMGKIKRYNM